jgi:hypothetical protein
LERKFEDVLKAVEETKSSSHREESMNHDELKFGLIRLLFPSLYFGLSAFYSCFDIYVLGNYEPKDGQWGSFQISLGIFGFMTLLASLSYWMSLDCLKTAPQRLPRLRLASITVLSSLLSWVVLLTFVIIQPHIAPMLFYLLFLAASVCLFPALIGVWLVKVHLRWYAAHPPA